MRRIIYEALSGLPSKIVSGAVGLGSIAATAWPDKFRLWVAGIMTADQIQHYGAVGIALFVAYWALMFWLKPTDVGEKPILSQTSLDPQSPNIGNTSGNVTINYGPSAEPPAAPNRYNLDNLDGLKRANLAAAPRDAFRDAVEQKKYEFLTRKHEPTRDTKMSDAFAFLCTGQWGERFFDVVTSGRCPDGIASNVRQLAFDGHITVWGKPPSNNIFVPIPKGYWETHSIEWFDLLKDKGARSEGYPSGNADLVYHDLMVDRIEVGKVYPFAK